MEKKCTKCKQTKALTEYGNLKKGKQGKCAYCKECAKKDLKEWTSNNKTRIQERSKKYIQSRWKQYRQDKSQEYINELFKNGIRRYILDKKGKSYEEILGAPYEEVKAYLEKQFLQNMKWSNHGDWHIDHKIPLSSAKTEEDFLKLNHFSNLQPLWAKDNLIKGAKITGELE
jgi:hypothetical protein